MRFSEVARYVDEGIQALERRALRDAATAFERAYRVAREANLGADARVGTLRNLALARREAGDHRGAIAAYRLALRIAGDMVPHRAAVLHGLGICYLRLGLCARARPLLAEAYALRRQALSSPGPLADPTYTRTVCVRVALDLSWALRALGLYDQAHQLMEPIRQELSGIDPSEAPYVHLELARIALARGRPAEARRHLARARRLAGGGDPAVRAQAELVEAERMLHARRHLASLAACARAADLAVRHRLWGELRDAHRLAARALEGVGGRQAPAPLPPTG